jgi:peptidoglycan/xylan/chitin deacetylase (PgdA/CDA1 family)
MYHGFTDKKNQDDIENYQGKHINIELFRSQIRYLIKNYNVIPLIQFIEYCIKGEKLPSKSVIITIDDGYKSNYSLAFPIFKEFDIPATIFLTTDFIGSRNFLWVDRLEYSINHTESKELKLNIGDEEFFFPLITNKEKILCNEWLRFKFKPMDNGKIEKAVQQTESKLNVKLSETPNVPKIYEPMTWGEISEMINTSKVDIGSHTHKHLILARYGNGVIRNELLQSKKIIERETGINTGLFCYPNGSIADFNNKTKLLLKESGYSCALTTVSGTNNEISDLYELKRFAVGNTDLKSFILTISGVKYFLSKMRSS